MNDLKFDTINSILDVVNEIERLVIILEVGLVSNDPLLKDILDKRLQTIFLVQEALVARRDEIAKILNLGRKIFPQIAFDTTKHYTRIMHKLGQVQADKIVRGFPIIPPDIEGHQVQKAIMNAGDVLFRLHDKNVLMDIIHMLRDICATIKSRIPAVVELLLALEAFSTFVPEVNDILAKAEQ